MEVQQTVLTVNYPRSLFQRAFFFPNRHGFICVLVTLLNRKRSIPIKALHRSFWICFGNSCAAVWVMLWMVLSDTDVVVDHCIVVLLHIHSIPGFHKRRPWHFLMNFIYRCYHFFYLKLYSLGTYWESEIVVVNRHWGFEWCEVN